MEVIKKLFAFLATLLLVGLAIAWIGKDPDKAGQTVGAVIDGLVQFFTGLVP